VNGSNKKERNGSLVPSLPPSSFPRVFFFLSPGKSKVRGGGGGSETSDQHANVLDNRPAFTAPAGGFPLPYLQRSSVNRENHLLKLYGHPPTSITTKDASRPPALVLITDLYSAVWSLSLSFSLPLSLSLILSPTTPPCLALLLSLSLPPSLSLPLSPTLSLSLSLSLPLSPSSSLVVRIHPTAEWLLCSCACAHRGSLSIWTTPPLCYFDPICSNSLRRQNTLTSMLQVARLLHCYACSGISRNIHVSLFRTMQTGKAGKYMTTRRRLNVFFIIA